MTARDIIANINKDPKFKGHPDLTRIAEEMGLEFYGWVENPRLVYYFFGSWYCTDSFVGYRVYFLDDAPVAFSVQKGRKCSEDFTWLTKGAWERVRDYILSLTEPKTVDIPDYDLDTDLGNWYKIKYHDQLFDYHLDIPLYLGERVKIVDKDRTNRGYKTEDGIYSESRVLIEYPGENFTKWIKLGELDFPFNANPA